jgi:hypothetical protein
MEDIIALLIGLGIGGVLFFIGISSFKRKLLIENTPTSKIRSIAMGLVEIYGSVVPAEGRLLKSPLTGKDCVYYKYNIEEYRSSGKSGSWVSISSGVKKELFYLKDSTGLVLIEPEGAEIEIGGDFKYQNSVFNSKPPASVIKFLDASGINYKGFFGFNKQMRFSEQFIAPGDNLYILGDAGDNPYMEEALAKSSVEDVMIHRGPNNLYYISDKSEKDVLKSFMLKMWAGLIIGGIMIVACLGLIFLYLGVL